MIGRILEGRMTAVTAYRISGHESFPCRYTWLPKVVRGLGDNPKLFSDEDQAMVEHEQVVHFTADDKQRRRERQKQFDIRRTVARRKP